MKKDNLLYVHFSNHWMIKGSSDGAGSAGKRPFLENLTSNTVLVQHVFFPSINNMAFVFSGIKNMAFVLFRHQQQRRPLHEIP